MNGERLHIDLFTGIGGFSLAARACGIRTVVMCERDEHCRAFLAKAWPGVPVLPDVRTFHWGGLSNSRREHGNGNPKGEGTGAPVSGQWNETQYSTERGDAVYLLTAGVPCQPASRAGKQRGAADDRWLWPEAVRVLGEVRPAWALFENPPGIGDVGLAGVLADVESHGYEVRCFGIPACAVGAPHRRERYWIVCRKLADACEEGREGADTEPGAHGLCAEHRAGDVADAEQDGRRSLARASIGQPTGHRHMDPWSDFVWLPCADGKVRRAPGDAFGLADGLHRSVLGALGNSIVPQVAQRVIAAIVEADNG